MKQYQFGSAEIGSCSYKIVLALILDVYGKIYIYKSLGEKMALEARSFDWTIDNRGSNKLNHNLYKTPEGEIYYHRLKFDNTDEEIITQVNPDVIWALEFDEAIIKKYYLKSRDWLVKDMQQAS